MQTRAAAAGVVWEAIMYIELVKAFVEVVKAAAWPAVLLIVALTYKGQLTAILPSVMRRKIEFEGLGFKAKIDATEQQQAAAENPATEKLPTAQSLDPSPREAVNVIEVKLTQDLKGIEADKKEAILLRALAQSRLEAGHEFTYNRIFGSQIAGLKRLNEVGRVTIDDARQFFNNSAENYPEIIRRSYTFEIWLGFLLGNELIKQYGSLLEITEYGRDFLSYLIHRRLSEIKPL